MQTVRWADNTAQSRQDIKPHQGHEQDNSLAPNADRLSHEPQRTGCCTVSTVQVACSCQHLHKQTGESHATAR